MLLAFVIMYDFYFIALPMYYYALLWARNEYLLNFLFCTHLHFKVGSDQQKKSTFAFKSHDFIVIYKY